MLSLNITYAPHTVNSFTFFFFFYFRAEPPVLARKHQFRPIRATLFTRKQ